jgi:predicted amidohydrolase YtcJ
MNLKPNHESRDLRINGVKCWADGSTQGGSAYLRENYLVEKWGKGNPNYTS